MGRFLLLVVALLAPLQAADPATARAFDHFYNLEYGEALSIFRTLTEAHPEEPDNYNNLAQTILYREMFRVGALESEMVTGSNPFLRRAKVEPSPEDQQDFTNSIERSIALTEARLRANPDDTAALHAQGVAYGLRANYNFIVRRSWMDALRDATRSRKLHNRITRIDPENVDALMVQAVHEYVVSLLPWHYRMLGFMIGFRGDRQGGIAGLERVAHEGVLNRIDARVLLCVVYRREHRPADAIPILQDLIRSYPRNYILRMEMVQMYSDLGKKDEALEVIADMIRLKKTGAPGYVRMPESKIWLSRGTLLFWYMDLDQALADFRALTSGDADLDLNTTILSWFRLGQTLDLLGRRDEALAAYRRVIDLAPNSERGSQARGYLRTPCSRGNRH